MSRLRVIPYFCECCHGYEAERKGLCKRCLHAENDLCERCMDARLRRIVMDDGEERV
jgi:hypothetical protein